MFGSQASSIKAEPRMFNFRYRSPEHFLDVFKTYYGPVLKAFAALDAGAQQDLHNDLYALIVRMNKSGDATMVVPERISRGRHHPAMMPLSRGTAIRIRDPRTPGIAKDELD